MMKMLTMKKRDEETLTMLCTTVGSRQDVFKDLFYMESEAFCRTCQGYTQTLRDL
jgi:hypothetical protein